ncbi:MAG: hypothetical protein NTU53_01890, partial [Planctomycetota bacterium]|nr:hypothetical protein [Planctomycetota bacterium]
MRRWAGDVSLLDDPLGEEVTQFLTDIETVGKGRFAQRLASIIAESETTACPDYIIAGVKYVISKCHHG